MQDRRLSVALNHKQQHLEKAGQLPHQRLLRMDLSRGACSDSVGQL